MKKIIKNNYFYGKVENRNNFIIDFALQNTEKKILIIDLESDINGLYPLTALNSLKTILLNTEANNILYYLGLLEEIDTIIINGIQNIDTLDDDHKNAIMEEVNLIKEDKDKLTIFLGKRENHTFKKNIKLKKVKLNKLEKKISKINKDLDLNEEDIYFIKRARIKMLENKSI